MAKRNPKPRNTGAAPIPRSGVPFEKAVARVQEMLDRNSKVTHNEVLEDRLGNKRQFDVVIRGAFAGHQVLGVVECRNHNRKMKPDAVEAFAKKCENLGAHLKIMVSNRGFSKQALRIAKHEGIVCLSLLPGDYGQTGLSLAVTWYAQVWEWVDVKMLLDNADVPPDLGEYGVWDVLWNGQPVFNLFLKELATTHVKAKDLGVLKRVMEFNNPVELEINGRSFRTRRIRFRATRICAHKRKRLEWFGDGVYNWQGGSWKFPTGGARFTSEWKGDYSDWEDFDGVIPPDRADPASGLVVLFCLPRLPPGMIAENPLGALYEAPIVPWPGVNASDPGPDRKVVPDDSEPPAQGGTEPRRRSARPPGVPTQPG